MHNTIYYKRTARLISIACGFLFTIFTVLYLYVIQSGLFAAAQHLLSDVFTTYNAGWGTVIITVLLLLLPTGLKKLLKLPLRFTALYYFFPSLLLGVLTSLVPDGEGGVQCDLSWWALILYCVLYFSLLWVILHYPDFSKVDKKGICSYLWPNFLLLFLLFLMTASLGYTSDVYHYRLRAEQLVVDGRFKEALEVGKSSLQTDRNLSAIRAYALSREGVLGERLFEYPQLQGSEGLLPESGDTIYSQKWTDSLYVHLGARPGKSIKYAKDFFRLLSARPCATSVVKDYLLCAYLLDGDLDSFVKILPVYYQIDENLPRYYKEALVLYGRMHINPSVVFHDSVIEENFGDFQKLESQHKIEIERANYCRTMFGTTYWWYYFYGRAQH